MSCRVPLSCLPFSFPRDEARTELSVSAWLTGPRALGRARAAPPGSLSCDKHQVCSTRVRSVVFFFYPRRCLHSFPWRLWCSSRSATCYRWKKQQNVNMWLRSIDAALRRMHRRVAQEIKTERWFMWVNFGLILSVEWFYPIWALAWGLAASIFTGLEKAGHLNLQPNLFPLLTFGATNGTFDLLSIVKIESS